MDVVILGLHLLVVVGAGAEAEVVVTAGAAVTVNPDHLLRGSEVLSVWREDLGALMTAGALSGARHHHHHQREGNAVQHLMRGAQKREAPPQGIVSRPPMVQTTVTAPG